MNPSYALSRPLSFGLSSGIASPDAGGGGFGATYLARITDGARYGFNDGQGRLYTTNQGTAPIAALGETVGLFLDNRQWGTQTLTDYLATQPEKVSNGDFASASGWTLSGGSTIIGGVARVLSVDGSLAAIAQTLPAVEAADLYRVGFDLSVVTSGNPALDFAGVSNVGISSALGAKTAFIAAVNAGSQGLTVKRSGGVTDFTFDNMSVKKVAGKHATQSSSTARAEFRKGLNGAPTLRFVSSDYYLTTMKPMAHVEVRAKLTGGTGERVLIGAADASNGRFKLYFNSAGQAAIRIGSGAELAFGGNLTGVDVVLGLTVHAASIGLSINGVEVATAALSGAPTTAYNLFIGAENVAGTPANYFVGDIITGGYGDAIIVGNDAPSVAELSGLYRRLVALENIQNAYFWETYFGESLSVGGGPGGVVHGTPADPENILTYSVYNGARGPLTLTLNKALLTGFVPMAEDIGETQGTGLCMSLIKQRRDRGLAANKYVFQSHGISGKRLDEIVEGGATTAFENGIKQLEKTKELVEALGFRLVARAEHGSIGRNDMYAGTSLSAAKASYVALKNSIQTRWAAVLGPLAPAPVVICDQSSATADGRIAGRAAIALLSAARDKIGIYLAMPNYIFGLADNDHPTAQQYDLMGEYHGKVEHRIVVEGEDWNPLWPTSVIRTGSSIVVDFYVPRGNLVIDDYLVPMHATKGFEYTTASITDVQQTGPKQVTISLSSSVAGVLRYAYTGVDISAEMRPGAWGNLRDEDAYPSQQIAGRMLYNPCVIFEENVA